MLSDTLLDRSPVWLIYAGTVLLLLAANEIGFRLGIWRRRSAAASIGSSEEE